MSTISAQNKNKIMKVIHLLEREFKEIIINIRTVITSQDQEYNWIEEKYIFEKKFCFPKVVQCHLQIFL